MSYLLLISQKVKEQYASMFRLQTILKTCWVPENFKIKFLRYIPGLRWQFFGKWQRNQYQFGL